MNLNIEFNPYENGKFLDSKLNYGAICYEADIAIDMVLSYPWLAQNKIGVFPHHRALVVDEPKLLLLYGQKDRGRPTLLGAKRQVRQVTLVGGHQGWKYPLSLPMFELEALEKPLEEEDLEKVECQVNLIEAKEMVGEEDPQVVSLHARLCKLSEILYDEG